MGKSRIVHYGKLSPPQTLSFRLSRRQLFVERLHRFFRRNVVDAPQRGDDGGRARFGESARQAAVNRAGIEAAQVRFASRKRNHAGALERKLVVVFDNVFHWKSSRISGE